MKLVEFRKTQFKRELYVCGHRVISFLRLWNILDTLMKDVSWLVAYRSLKQRDVELPADCHLYWSEWNELVEIPIGDLKRVWTGGAVPLGETTLVRYLKSGDESILRGYYQKMAEAGGLSQESIETCVRQSKRLFEKKDTFEYDPSVCCIVINERNEIVDGYHRSSVIFARHGAEHKVKVLRLLPDIR